MARHTLLDLSGEIADALRDRDPAAIGALRAVGNRVGAVVIGDGRPLRLDPVATALTLSLDAPGVPVLVGSDGLRDAPYNAARRFLALDHLSGGRAGVVFRSGDGDASRTAERIRVIRELWNSWPRETLRADREAGVFATTDGIRRIAHAGEHYRVAGALNSPTSIQGEPVSIWRVETEAELEAADGLVDVVAVGSDALADAWARLDARSRPALARADGGEGADLSVVSATSVADLEALRLGAPSAAAAGATLRERLGLPARALDLSDRPLAFGDAR